MNTKQGLVNITTKTGIFLLRSAGGIGIGIGIGFAFSYLVKHPGRIDTFTLVESMLGIVITGLSIVAAFIVALQWSGLDSRIQSFDNKMIETKIDIQNMLRNIEGIKSVILENYELHKQNANYLENKYKEFQI